MSAKVTNLQPIRNAILTSRKQRHHQQNSPLQLTDVDEPSLQAAAIKQQGVALQKSVNFLVVTYQHFSGR